MQKTLIRNIHTFNEITAQIKKDGPNSFYVLSDFDGTLTQGYVSGKKTPSLISILRDEKYLSSDYALKAHALFRHYHPFEIDTSLPLAIKKEKMHEWWMKHFELLLASGLHRKDIARAVTSKKIQLREGTKNFISLLAQLDIPLIIISASGLGEESISLFLEEAKLLYKNIHIIANTYTWDASGKATGITKPIIHALNKNEILRKNHSFYDLIKKRTNALILGDNLEDAHILHDGDVAHTLKIGFLNDPDAQPKTYSEVYDAVLLNDSDLDYVTELLHTLFDASISF